MSYARYTPHYPALPSGPHYRALPSGLGDAQADFSTYLSADQAANTQSQGSTDSLVAYAKEAQAIKSYYDDIKKYGPKRWPRNFKDGAKMAADGLYRYSKDYAKGWAKKEMDELASSYGFQGCVPDHLPRSTKEAFHTGADIAAAGACYSMGIEPKLGVTTVDSLWDGRISAEECEAIGAVAGAAAAAAVGQMFGIPAPIGAFIGGKVGGLVGKGIAKLFGLSSDARRKWLAEQRKIVKQIQAQADQQCYQIRQAYWQMFDKLLVEIEAQWEHWELTVGAKFDLRWFDPTPGFYAWIQQQSAQYKSFVDGPYCQLTCDSTVIYKGDPYLKTHTQAQLDALIKSKCAATAQSSGELCAYGCAVEFGCLYPRFATWKKSNTPTDKRLFGSTQRVIDAFLAHGFEWMPPPTGVKLVGSIGGQAPIYASKQGERILVCDLPAATKKDVEKTKYRDIWIKMLETLVNHEVTKANNLHTVQVRILNDLIKTASIAQAQVEIAKIVERQKKEQAALVTRVAPKLITDPGRLRNQVINTGALVGGSGLLLWSLL